jgi:hypothetical protein
VVVGASIAGLLAARVLAGHVDRVSVVPRPKGPAVVLVRPDGYVAWASDSADAGTVRAAVREWCGPALVTS